MSEYQTQIGYMCKVLSVPCKDYDEYHESGLYDKLKGIGVYLNYNLTLCRVLDVDQYGEFDGVVFTNDHTKYVEAITQCEKVEDFGIALHDNLKPFVCSWYNGVDNPLDTMTLEEFNKILKLIKEK